jgi:hypothetical protein
MEPIISNHSISFMDLLDILSKLGGFLTGIAAILALYFGSKAVKDYWRIKRSNAASAALSKVRMCIDDIADVTLRKELYKYPSFPQELATDKTEKIHPERPARLIEFKVKQLQKDLHEPISQLSGKEGTQLLQLVSKLQAYCPHLSSAVFVSIRANNGCEASKEQLKPIQHYLDDCQATLVALNAEADKFLIPIIESIKE